MAGLPAVVLREICQALRGLQLGICNCHLQALTLILPFCSGPFNLHRTSPDDLLWQCIICLCNQLVLQFRGSEGLCNAEVDCAPLQPAPTQSSKVQLHFAAVQAWPASLDLDGRKAVLRMDHLCCSCDLLYTVVR